MLYFDTNVGATLYWKVTVERPLRLAIDLSPEQRARFRAAACLYPCKRTGSGECRKNDKACPWDASAQW